MSYRSGASLEAGQVLQVDYFVRGFLEPVGKPVSPVIGYFGPLSHAFYLVNYLAEIPVPRNENSNIISVPKREGKHVRGHSDINAFLSILAFPGLPHVNKLHCDSSTPEVFDPEEFFLSLLKKLGVTSASILRIYTIIQVDPYELSAGRKILNQIKMANLKTLLAYLPRPLEKCLGIYEDDYTSFHAIKYSGAGDLAASSAPLVLKISGSNTGLYYSVFGRNDQVGALA